MSYKVISFLKILFVNATHNTTSLVLNGKSVFKNENSPVMKPCRGLATLPASWLSKNVSLNVCSATLQNAQAV